MYVPAWQGLSPRHLFSRRRGPTPFPLDRKYIGFHIARNAIYHVTRALEIGDGTVLMPAYHSGNETGAVRAAGARIKYYGVDRRFQPDLDEVERLARQGARVLFVIHFVGWSQPLDAMLEICRRHGMILIEDCALAFLSTLGDRPLGSIGDYGVFCIYKTLPVPSGGLLVENGKPLPLLADLELRPCGWLSTAGRASELGLEWLRSRVNFLGAGLAWCKGAAGSVLSGLGVRRVPIGDMGFRLGDVNVGMGKLSRSMSTRFDCEDIVRRRRENFSLLRNRLSGHGGLLDLDLEPGTCPLFFPILVKDKPKAAEELRRHGICATQFWNWGDKEADGLYADVTFLRDHVLELPIHQDIRPDQIDHMVQHLARIDAPGGAR